MESADPNSCSYYDVIVIGGGASGSSAGLSLGRVCRKVLILDDESYRNKPAKAMHNVLGQDGKNPVQFVTEGRESMLKIYKTTHYIKANVSSIKEINTENSESPYKFKTCFRLKVNLDDEDDDINKVTDYYVYSKRLILGTGIHDCLPDDEEIKGNISNLWGKSIVHCPYCHGYELRNGTWAFLLCKSNMTSQEDVNKFRAEEKRDSKSIRTSTIDRISMASTGDPVYAFITLLQRIPTNGFVLLTNGLDYEKFFTKDQVSNMKNKIKIYTNKIEKIVKPDDTADVEITFDNKESIKLSAIYIRTPYEYGSLMKSLDLELNSKGEVKTFQYNRSSNENIFVCGDCMDERMAVPRAMANGSMAGFGANTSLSNQEFNSK